MLPALPAHREQPGGPEVTTRSSRASYCEAAKFGSLNVRHRSIASVERSRHVGFTPNSGRMAATQLNDASGHVWTAPSWQGESSRRRLGRCSHVFGL